MRTESSWSRLQPWLSTIIRLGLAAVFLVAGGLKVTDLDGSARAVNAYELMPWEVAKIVGAVQPVLEIGIGLLLLLGLATRLAAWLAAISMVVFIAGISSAWARGLSIDCGCFSKGGALPVGTSPNYTWDIVRDVAFLALAVFLILFPSSRFSIDGGSKNTSTMEESERE
ncbi:putative membrane protein YphA (DoxX/SURF4 family) [Allocatelliglobosispora scoriae]|uniref:Putative membrane protein YphA (DoxX/SURF4 family) n=1 Tax=Allocatelliglobosispora scoriae TaxID=643052 RepID=A0A841BRV9_9ACTN|nr:MauE/DoxX family redox-associated membrane protein [Allocatelliglobosispora scoriae]MBB5870126.1 putative membrane protein YphA (DoxX/SURF4 family) [Allocatelliglobosispora scoriae]